MNEERKYIAVKGGHIHRYPAFEECNVDDAGERVPLSEEDALHAMAERPESACGHCFPAPVALIHDDDVSAD